MRIKKTQYIELRRVGYVCIQLPFPIPDQVVHKFSVEKNLN